jgi:lactoylglutathione lyase
MKRLLFCLLLCSLSLFSRAQSSSTTIDHVGLLVSNLDSSVAFYSGLFQLDSLPNPWKGQRVKWFKIGNKIQLHLIEGLKEKIMLPIMTHLSLSLPSLDIIMLKLARLSIPYYNGLGEINKFQVRGDGVKQFLIKDPDGYWIEINNAVH